MPSDASEMPAEPEPLETEAANEPPAWTLAEGVDLDSPDPADVGARTRQCVAATQAGARCRAPAINGEILCSHHAGRLDAAAGGHARARKLRLVREEAQNREINARLGTRAVVAAALAAKHEQITSAIGLLADRAADGDRQCALALLPFMTQALGTPAAAAATVVATPEGDVDLSALDTASLRALLHAEPSP